MIKVTDEGSFKYTQSFLQRCMSGDIFDPIERLADEGVQRLIAATPQESGLTAASWYYEIVEEGNTTTLWFGNNNVEEGFNIAVGLQYGHGTNGGGWVGGIDYINPALRPVFDKIQNAVWEEVAKR